GMVDLYHINLLLSINWDVSLLTNSVISPSAALLSQPKSVGLNGAFCGGFESGNWGIKVYDFSCPIIPFSPYISCSFSMLKPLNLVPFGCVPIN
ncbi:MAG: hypothetical protein OEV42_14305, partial [Deltaproteobacteria bacterium]|nr:hypothetical protein [Deltaproteobacteria bacterium]